METETQQAKVGQDRPHPHIIEIEVDEKPRTVEQGKYTGSQLKTMFGIPADMDLDRWQGDRFVPVPDNEPIQLHPKDVFVSHARNGGSS